MNEQYFGKKNVFAFHPSFLFMLKLRIFGKKITEYRGNYVGVWYLYKDVLYMTKYQNRYL